MKSVIVTHGEKVICTGKTRPEHKAPFALWKAVVVSPEADKDAVVERLQASNSKWEAYVTAENDYVILLPPMFKVTPTNALF